ncbi:MAG: histidine phosphatase family protein, partial [Lactobacillus iners]|nr:histidine phosphatase family protein [Lactobacillus iners]
GPQNGSITIMKINDKEIKITDYNKLEL